MIKNIQNLINEERYQDASALAIHLELTFETRELFERDRNISNEKFDAYENLLLADAKDDFDCYNRFLDYRQPLRRNLYLDRRKYLKEIADEVTDMFSGKPNATQVLRVKLRTRSAKSEIFNRAANWVQAKQPNGETLYVVGGGNLRDNMYNKRIAFIDEYWERHLQVFPDMKVHKTSKEYASVWFSDREYADISTVTVGGSIEGWVQCTNMLILDDLVGSSEINSAKRLEDIYTNDILNAIMRRYISGPIIIIGTPIPTQTGVSDPSDAFYENRKKAGYVCKEIIVPYISGDNRSNYEYRDFNFKPPKRIFTTEEALRERNAAYSDDNPLAKPTFDTVYQMKGMEVGERRFAKVKTFAETPSGKYREINILDPADAGEDKAAFVHCRIYDAEPESVYVHDIFYDGRPMDRAVNNGYLDDVVHFMIRNDIHLYTYEANMGGTLLGETIKEIGEELGWRFEYDEYKQTKNKTQRILDNAMGLLDVVKVRDVPHTEIYESAISELRMWTNKSKKDDFTDALTKAVEVFKNPEIKKPNQIMFTRVI